MKYISTATIVDIHEGAYDGSTNIHRLKRNNQFQLFNVCHDSALFGVDHNTIFTPSPLSGDDF